MVDTVYRLLDGNRVLRGAEILRAIGVGSMRQHMVNNQLAHTLPEVETLHMNHAPPDYQWYSVPVPPLAADWGDGRRVTGHSDAHVRGHEIINLDGEWCYTCNGLPISMWKLPCPRCGRQPTVTNRDACLGEIPGALEACCGHGVEDGYVLMRDGSSCAIPQERGKP